MTDTSKTPKKIKRTQTATYVGGPAGAIVSLPSGRTLTFERGTPLEIMASEQTALANHPEFKLADEAVGETQ
tara:strand:+ start:1808 stop:2023 length:216 start_codon:yes stop_codon:yes gene_type:complete